MVIKGLVPPGTFPLLLTHSQGLHHLSQQCGMRLWLWFSILQVGNKLPTVWEQLRVPSVKADLVLFLLFSYLELD